MIRPLLPLLGLSAGLLAAQEPDGGFGDLKALMALRQTRVVSASKREQSLLDSPQAMDVITADQIRASGAFRLVDILRLATGVQVWDEAPTRSSVSLRGVHPLGSARTFQVLVDGVPLFNFMAAPLDFNGLPVPLDLIERVEIVRGPSSSLYGSNAQMGVIAIFTRRAEAGFRAEGRAGFADHQTYRANAQASGTSGPFSFVLGGAAASLGDVDRPMPVMGRPGATIPQSTASREQQFFFRGAWEQGVDRLWALVGTGDAGHFDERSVSPATLTPIVILPDQSTRREILQAGWARAWSPALQTELRLQQKVVRLRMDAMRPIPGDPVSLATWTAILASDPAFGADRDFYRDRVRQATLQANWSPAAGVHTVFGADTTSIATIPNLTIGLPEAHHEHASGAFASVDWNVGDFTLSGGARAERETLGGNRVSPRAGLSWRVDEDSSLRLGWFTSTRSPTLQEKASAIGDLAVLPYVQAPSQGLRSEEADSLELGYRREGDGWIFGVTAFRTRLRHLISLRPAGALPSGKPIRQYQNGPGTLTDQGLELNGQVQFGHHWRFGGNLATADFKDPINDLDRQADYTPRVTASLWGRWSQGPWFAFLGLSRMSATTIIAPMGANYVPEDVPATLQALGQLGWRPLPALSIAVYGVNATHPTTPTAPLGLTNGFAQRLARRELGVQLSWRP